MEADRSFRRGQKRRARTQCVRLCHRQKVRVDSKYLETTDCGDVWAREPTSGHPGGTDDDWAPETGRQRQKCAEIVWTGAHTRVGKLTC